MIILFEKYKNKPDVNTVSPEFWKMVRIADWAKVIKTSKVYGSSSKLDYVWEQAQKRIFLKYEYDDIVSFSQYYHTFYILLYDYFQPIWLSKKYNSFMPSDDGYSDLLSSIIGMGKTFVKSCIDDTNKFIEVARNEDYVENFGYILDISENEYWDIIEKYDPNNTRVVAKKYNL